MGKRRLLDLTLLLISMPFFGASLTAADASRPKPKGTVLFLCPHGGAKSVIAASYFNRLAEELELPWTGVAAAVEEPYDAVPLPVAAFLENEGFDVRSFKPRHVDAADVTMAARVVSIDSNLECMDIKEAAVERWDDVPKMSVDLEASAAAIRLHVDALAADLRAAVITGAGRRKP